MSIDHVNVGCDAVKEISPNVLGLALDGCPREKAPLIFIDVFVNVNHFPVCLPHHFHIIFKILEGGLTFLVRLE
jgi:hypothetical protein